MNFYTFIMISRKSASNHCTKKNTNYFDSTIVSPIATPHMVLYQITT